MSSGALPEFATKSASDDRPAHENLALLSGRFFASGRPRRIDHCAGLVASKDPVTGEIHKHSVVTDAIWKDFEAYAAQQYSGESVDFWQTGLRIVQGMEGPIPDAGSDGSKSEQGDVIRLRAKLQQPGETFTNLFEKQPGLEPHGGDAPQFVNLPAKLAIPLTEAIDAYDMNSADPDVRTALGGATRDCLIELAGNREVVGQLWHDFLSR